MSLINQMLQDLEHRSAGNLVGGGLSQQIRAVPERGGIHVAWWLVLLLALLLAGLCVGWWMRPAPAPMQPPMALRLASDLQTLPSPAAQPPLPDQSAPVPVPPSATTDRAADTTTSPSTRRNEHVQAKPNAVVPESKPLPLPRLKAESSIDKTGAPAESPYKVNNDSSSTTELTKQVKELTPQQRAENSYRMAGSALQLGRQADAIADLEQALQFDGQHVAAREMLVGLLLQAKRMDEAGHRAQDGLAIDPTQVGLSMILARVQVEQGDLHAALDTLQHGLSYARERADYQAFFAALLQRDKRHKEAIEHYMAALARAPQNGVWWMGLGISLQAENRLPEAKEAFGRAKTSTTLTPDLQIFVDQKLAQIGNVRK